MASNSALGMLENFGGSSQESRDWIRININNDNQNNRLQDRQLRNAPALGFGSANLTLECAININKYPCVRERQTERERSNTDGTQADYQKGYPPDYFRPANTRRQIERSKTAALQLIHRQPFSLAAIGRHSLEHQFKYHRDSPPGACLDCLMYMDLRSPSSIWIVDVAKCRATTCKLVYWPSPTTRRNCNR